MTSISSSATGDCLIQMIEVITFSLALLFSPNDFYCFNPLGRLPFEFVFHQPLLACISTVMKTLNKMQVGTVLHFQYYVAMVLMSAKHCWLDQSAFKPAML